VLLLLLVLVFCHITVASQGKRHQQNLAKRAAREAAEKQAAPAPQRRVQIKKTGETLQCDTMRAVGAVA
jgi:hypothetical protein